MPKLELYSVRDNIVQEKAGLNWCFADAHVNSCDAYIALTKRFFQNHNDFFPKHGSIIETIWDDGFAIECLLEGTQEINGVTYPKQISSYGDKSIIGEYLRGRLGVSRTHLITMNDLRNYGRFDVDVSLISGIQYRFDFS